MSMKKKHIARMVTLALILIAAAHFIPYAASLGVIQIYSSIHEKQGLPERQGLTIKIPGGLATAEKDWYPLVLTYHAGKDFGRWVGAGTIIAPSTPANLKKALTEDKEYRQGFRTHFAANETFPVYAVSR